MCSELNFENVPLKKITTALTEEKGFVRVKAHAMGVVVSHGVGTRCDIP